MEILKVTDERFKKYGRIVENIDFSELVEKMQSTPLPEDVIYEPSIEELELLDVAKELQNAFYGELPIQIGYCNGHNKKLNAVEYHRSSEINVAATDCVLILGNEWDIETGYTYRTDKMEAFLVPKGIAVELFATTLHYAPCHVEDKGFLVTVILPKGTNYPLEKEHKGGEDALLAAQNKWLIGHKEGGLAEGSHIGLIGENLTIA